MQLDWHVGWWSESLVNTTDVENLDLINLADLDKYEDDIIVERVVGQYFLRSNATDGPHLFATRLYTCDTAQSESGVNLNLFLFDDADYAFMWHKVQVLDMLGNAGSQNMFSSASHPEWSHIDVKVNRRLSDMKLLRFRIDSFTPDVSFTYGAWIRVLVKH